jgi:hypothetical protein
MANEFSSYGIIIVEQFCNEVTFYVSFLDQHFSEESVNPWKPGVERSLGLQKQENIPSLLRRGMKKF